MTRSLLTTEQVAKRAGLAQYSAASYFRRLGLKPSGQQGGGRSFLWRPDALRVVRDAVKNPKPRQGRGDTTSYGAAAELAVAADLTRHGFHVFRAVSHTAPVDLIAMFPGGVFRVEVKSWRPSNGGWGRKIRNECDVIAVWIKGVVTYEHNSGRERGGRDG